MLKITPSQKESIKKFNQMVKSGEMTFEEKDCLCGHSDFQGISQYDRYGFPQKTVMCKKCGLIMSNPRLTEKSYQLFYSTDIYRTIYEEQDYLEMAEDRLKNNYGFHLYEDIAPVLKENKKIDILEFGCGGGWNLMHFAKKGHRVTGYDYSPGLTKVGRNFGLDLRQGTIKDIEGEYDLIILNHVMEHFTDLINSMKTISKHLKPDGLMYIGVPNIDNYDLGQLQNAHVYYFTPRTLKFFMNRCGLNAIKMDAAEEIHMYGIFNLDHNDLNDFTLESEPKRIIKTIRRAQMKERIGRFLEKIGIKNFIKTALRKLSPKR